MPKYLVNAFFYDYDGDHHEEYREAQSEIEAKRIAKEYYSEYSDDVQVSIYKIEREIFVAPENA